MSPWKGWNTTVLPLSNALAPRSFGRSSTRSPRSALTASRPAEVRLGRRRVDVKEPVSAGVLDSVWGLPFQDS